jgi:hypothetical protein
VIGVLAIRLIRIKLQVVRVEPPDSVLNADDEWAHDDDENPLPDWSNFKGERLPVVHFCGKSWSLHASFDPNANSRIRGEFCPFSFSFPFTIPVICPLRKEKTSGINRISHRRSQSLLSHPSERYAVRPRFDTEMSVYLFRGICFP